MSRNLLIADDDPAIRNLARECLTTWDTTCIEADDGLTAIRLAGEQKPDAVLLDMNMPRMDGFEVCRRLKANPSTKRIPIIFVTSNADVADKVRGIDMGAADYITKPFHPGELQARVKSVIRVRMELDKAEGLAARDSETGLFNRAYFEQRIEADLAASRRHGHPLACCIAKIDDSEAPKPAPESKVDDGLMYGAAQRLLSVLRREDVACRYDRRSFGVIGFLANEAGAVDLGRRVLEAISAATSTPLGGRQLPVHVGVALSHYSIGDMLVWHANEAMRNAQLNGQGAVQFGGDLLQLQLVDRSAN